MDEQTQEQMEAEMEKWRAGKPERIQDLSRRFPPWKWYRLIDPDADPEERKWYAYQVVSYSENDDMQMIRFAVGIPAEPLIDGYPANVMWRVYLPPGDLEECPSPDEQFAAMSEEEQFEAAKHAAGRMLDVAHAEISRAVGADDDNPRRN